MSNEEIKRRVDDVIEVVLFIAVILVVPWSVVLSLFVGWFVHSVIFEYYGHDRMTGLCTGLLIGYMVGLLIS